MTAPLSPPSSGELLLTMSHSACHSVMASLSPYIAGEFLSLDEAGTVSFFKGTGEILPIPSHGHQFILCCYGNQPRSLLLATPTNIFAFDIRVREYLAKLLCDSNNQLFFSGVHLRRETGYTVFRM